MVPDRSFTISFTSDIHGYFSNLDYASGKELNSGLCNCAGLFVRNENALIIDGGDTLQGSPFTYCYHQTRSTGTYLPAQVMKAAGYHFLTLGNHDFDYGIPQIEEYQETCGARCLCANVKGIRGVEKTALVTLKNGIRVGLTGVTSHYVTHWEPQEKLAGITVTDAFEAASSAFDELKEAGADVTVCIYHGGFERDVATGQVILHTDENQGWRICQELGYDVLLTGHQPLKIESADLFGTHTCQVPDKGSGFLRVDVQVPTPEKGEKISAVSRFIPAGETRDETLWRLLAPYEERAAHWLDRPVGHLDVPLLPEDPLSMALHGTLIANFFNQVQLEATGADVSVTGLANVVTGFTRKSVSIRDVVSSYIFSNTLKVIEVDRRVLAAALERCAEYFMLDEKGKIGISSAFLLPIPQHYNYDYFSGIEAVFDLTRPVGERVISIRFQGEELDSSRKLTLCLNNYRASGAGGYPLYAECPLLSEKSKEIAELIMDYISSHREIVVDQTKWLTVLSERKEETL